MAERRVIMCNGIILNNNQYCPHEIKSGPNWGDCAKPKRLTCPETLEEEEQEEIEEDDRE